MTLQQIFSSQNFDENPFTLSQFYTALKENGFHDLSPRLLTTDHALLTFLNPQRKKRFNREFRLTAGAGSNFTVRFGSENIYI